MTTPLDTSELDALLDAAVRETTGLPHAAARPAQRVISQRMWSVISSARARPTWTEHEDNPGPDAPQCALEAPTGSGKGLAYLVPAVLAAAKFGTRTLVSTESLPLQTQLVKKDFPAVARAAMALYGQDVRVAVHKGWANYGCVLQAAYAAAEVVGNSKAERDKLERASAADLADLGSRAAAADPVNGPLLGWVLGQPAVGGEGDKSSCNVDGAASRWDDVSIDPDSCLAGKCPLFELCLPEQARQKAADADVIVANHSLLAVQAAKAVPVVIGNGRIGEIHAVVVDEAHTLPGQVRSTGATMLSGRSITSALRAVERIADPSSPGLSVCVKAAGSIAEVLDEEIAAAITNGADTRIEPGVDPLKRSGDAIAGWVEAARRIVRPVLASGHGPSVLQGQAVAKRLTALVDATRDVREGGLGMARWASPGRATEGKRTWVEMHASPVEVGPLLSEQVFSAPVEVEPEDRHNRDMDWGVPRYTLPVVTCSATMPTTFTGEAGLRCDIEEFPSPFTEAYSESILFVPHPDGAPRMPSWGKGKPRLDTGSHPAWALGIMRELIDAAGGRALVLSANAEAGRTYAQALRVHARGRWTVLDAWTTQREQAVAAWRSDEAAVLVGTRGLMTGVDAPGATCSLVIVDRIPRSASNPVDEARKDLAAAKVGKWEADALVYVADAAALLEQAGGRLIRSAGDRGVVAVLDPRLLKGELAYAEKSRQAYMKALGHFTRKTASVSQATEYLRALTNTPGAKNWPKVA